MKKHNFIQTAKNVLEIEANSVLALQQYLNEEFQQACGALLACSGKVIVTGMGKSGHIAKKLAATFASTGTPSFYVHPAEASHGDLGMIEPNDIVLALSNSGETEEVLHILPTIKRIGAKLISMTSKPNSTLAYESDLHITCAVEKEACTLGLAPTSSTTAALAMGDAIAVSLLEAREFSKQDFAISHPAGALGRRLLLRVADLMQSGDELPCVTLNKTIYETLLVISAKGMGFTAVVDQDNVVIGVYTDGDLRRSLDKRIDIYSTKIVDVIKKGCVTVQADLLAAEALQIMEEKAVNGLIVVDHEQHPIGAINMHHLLKAKVL
ncbi:D-arabinose 5-phosphate isomerase [Saccharobesus litoralis]|uniref:Arabinose 5-phosphate isomerase n=1 Tax=Saccharobesus litoralis TaxID=2172099 RepID=A0A2S0VWP9_9ALTE|nr:KpsF/GutQ family sugar-phosphate isomerase [Saccharobesus litoralis]AWB68646.1 D-arabinose 5-phosphate isomerase [Saccharobesus litoralis]